MKLRRIVVMTRVIFKLFYQQIVEQQIRYLKTFQKNQKSISESLTILNQINDRKFDNWCVSMGLLLSSIYTGPSQSYYITRTALTKISSRKNQPYLDLGSLRSVQGSYQSTLYLNLTISFCQGFYLVLFYCNTQFDLSTRLVFLFTR